MEKSLEPVRTFYETTEGLKIIQLTRCFLEELIRDCSTCYPDEEFLTKKRHFFYYEHYDFVFEIINDLLLMKAFNSKKGLLLYQTRYNFMNCTFSEEHSMAYFDSFYIEMVHIPAFSFFPELLRNTARAINKPLNIRKEVIEEYLEGEGLPLHSSLAEDFMEEHIPDRSIFSDQTLKLLREILEETQRPKSFLTTIAKTEYDHHTNRLLSQELPLLFSSYCALNEELQNEKKSLLDEQLVKIHGYLMEKKELEGLSVFERNVSLLQEQYHDS